MSKEWERGIRLKKIIFWNRLPQEWTIKRGDTIKREWNRYIIIIIISNADELKAKRTSWEPFSNAMNRKLCWFRAKSFKWFPNVVIILCPMRTQHNKIIFFRMSQKFNNFSRSYCSESISIFLGISWKTSS